MSSSLIRTIVVAGVLLLSAVANMVRSPARDDRAAMPPLPAETALSTPQPVCELQQKALDLRSEGFTRDEAQVAIVRYDNAMKKRYVESDVEQALDYAYGFSDIPLICDDRG